MARFFQIFSTEEFASGATTYDEQVPGFESSHIVLPICISDMNTIAILDTGSTWCIFDPEIINQVGVTKDDWYDTERQLSIRGMKLHGNLISLPICLLAEQGSDLEIQARIFVPEWNQPEPWPFPNFVGLDGLLTSLRFAIDPTENMFYFGLA